MSLKSGICGYPNINSFSLDNVNKFPSWHNENYLLKKRNRKETELSYLSGYSFLKRKLSIRNRKPISFISLLSLCQMLPGIKKESLARLKADRDSIEKISIDSAGVMSTFIGKSNNLCVIAAPEGRSCAKNGWHVASVIAEKIANEINAEYLPRYFTKNSRNKRQDDIVVNSNEKTNGRFCLFVDDILTTGITAINCLNKLSTPRIAFIAISNL